MSQETKSAAAMKRCPKCQEEIQLNATKCKHCGADLRSWFRRHPIWSVILGFLLFSFVLGAIKEANTQSGSSPAPSSNAASDQTPKEWVQIFTLKGKGNNSTDSFDTIGGRLKLVAKTSGSRVGSFSGISLKSDSGEYLSGAQLNISTDDNEPGTGETIIRDARAGSYYVSVISGVDWEVAVYEER